MKRGFLAILAAILLAGGILPGCSAPEAPVVSSESSEEATAAVTAPSTQPSEIPTQAQTEAPTQPQPESFLLTFVGDCTLGAPADHFSYGVAFVKTVGDDYAYPFRNVAEYFRNDDFTMINLENPLTEGGTRAAKQHVFRGPVEYVNIITQNSVEAVTIANNHTFDFGQEGYESTVSVLREAGVPFVEKDSTTVVTTGSGLTIGLYAVTYENLDKEAILAAISALAANPSVDVVVFAPHWGTENSYRANSIQKELAHAAIDAGANIVYGSHAHVLQPIEEYNGGIIYYSLGNFSFGGNAYPKDYDTALLQQQVIRQPDGTVCLGELTIVPCSLSSETGKNNFQPTPYAPGTEEYDRVLRKLDGTFTGADLGYD